ncbi:hypothetical protein [Thermanaeromonas toyohensis]|uniref:hypothetical protein n=1 Tax=Thermanaeromonas toyohensis TaxID=161154 RepID=UPI000A05561F|nr:hypothetical protein [Thermanaeromonas toyohensis]
MWRRYWGRSFQAEASRSYDRAASVIRTEEGLGRALEELKELKKVKLRADDHGLAYALENEKMLLVAEMIVRSALLRDESRGPHLRFATWDSPILYPAGTRSGKNTL